MAELPSPPIPTDYYPATKCRTFVARADARRVKAPKEPRVAVR